MYKYLIICKDKDEFNSYIEYNKLDSKNCKFVENVEDLIEANTRQIILCGKYFMREDIQDIIDQINKLRQIQRSSKTQEQT